jgi:glycosyltransferase involved in cell wall biosynthesis
VVLPSYYWEDTPRTLLEAASMAKPFIAADSIRTREPVENGETGFLCRPRDAHDLAEKMEQIINMGRKSREQMGWRGQEKMIREYDENIVIEKYLKAIREITNSS